MSQMDVVLFEDSQVAGNYPATLSRPAYAITCGVRNLYDVVKVLGARVRTVTRAYLAPVAQRRFPGDEGAGGGPTLFVNAAVVPDVKAVNDLIVRAGEGAPFCVRSGERIAAALVTDDVPADLSVEGVEAFLASRDLPEREMNLATIDYPFDIVRHHVDIFERNLADLIHRRRFLKLARGVYAGEGVKIASTAVLHAEDGPIVLDEGVTVMDFAYLSGPLYVGPNSRIIERSSIKEHVSIGPTCKIGGEVEAAVVEAFSNKQHHGFLGHAHVGSWVNLGAGTSNSDLKNTYGTVRVEVAGERIETDMQFFGCVIGDYSKSAINTSILTGKIVGVASMMYGFVSTNVPSFCNYARSFGQATEVDVETAIETQRRMFVRRKIEQTDEDVALMRAMYDLTHHERRMSAEQVSF